jgi:hypothetical protein
MIPPQHERVLAALELREPDRVPTFDLMMETGTVFRALDKKPALVDRLMGSGRLRGLIDRAYPLVYRNRLLTWLAVEKQQDTEMEQFARSAAAASVKLGYDSAWVSFYPVYRVRDSGTIDDIFGRRNSLAIDRNGYLQLPVYREGLIKSPDDWTSLNKSPILKLPEKGYRVYASIQKEWGDRLFIFGFISQGLFENTWQPLGFERFAVALRKERAFVDRMIRFYADFFCLGLQALADTGIPAVLFSDDLAYKSGPMLSPRLFDELYGDHYRRITETAHSLGMKIIIHSCGNVMPLLNWMADCGFDGVQSLEPTAGVELAAAKELAGHRLCLIGNLDVTRVLVDSSREEVFEAVRKAIRDAGRGGGFILSPEHDHADVSLERLQWMVEAVRRYGTYPLTV